MRNSRAPLPHPAWRNRHHRRTRGHPGLRRSRARATAEFGRAAETVTDAKKKKVTAMAVDYLARHHITNRPCRFDVVAIDQALNLTPEITVYPNAFDAAGL